MGAWDDAVDDAFDEAYDPVRAIERKIDREAELEAENKRHDEVRAEAIEALCDVEDERDELEAENAALKHDVSRQMAIANELAQWQEEARGLLQLSVNALEWWRETFPDGSSPADDEHIAACNALLEGDMGIPASEGGNDG